MAALPYMQLYVAEYLADTMHLDAMESGAYLHLLMNYWQTGKPLADDARKLARIAKCTDEQWSNICSTIVQFFKNEDGFWTHKRVEKDLEKVREKSQSRAEAGRKSGKSRQENAIKSTTLNKCSTNGGTNTSTKSNYLDTDTDTKRRVVPDGTTGAGAPEPIGDVPRKTLPPEEPKPKPTPRSELLAILDAEHAEAVLDHRKRLRKPLTAHAAHLLALKFSHCRDGPNAAADAMVSNGWQGFEAEWMENRNGNRASNGAGKPSRYVDFLRESDVHEEDGGGAGREPDPDLKLIEGRR